MMANSTSGHNNQIGNHCHFAPQACLGSKLNISNGVYIGLNASIRENIKIGAYSVLGMGSVLLKNMGEAEIWVGNPARFIRKAE